MELKENHIYTTQEIKDFFSVSESTWKKKRDTLLRHLSLFYDYEIIYDNKDHRKRNYLITKKKQDYIEYSSNAKKEIDKRDRIFEKEIIDVIENDNLQTAKNISRLIDEDIKKEFDYTSGTIYEYTRLRVNEWFGKGNNTCGTKGMITEKIWCCLDTEHNYYIRLSEEQKKYLFEIYGEEKGDLIEKELSLISDCENGLITKEILYKEIGDYSYCCFTKAKDKFKERYGYYPIKVPVYEIGVFTLDFE